jgi:hypothetical protein
VSRHIVLGFVNRKGSHSHDAQNKAPTPGPELYKLTYRLIWEVSASSPGAGCQHPLFHTCRPCRQALPLHRPDPWSRSVRVFFSSVPGRRRFGASHVVMPDAMPCREYKRLRTDYEAALRRWGDVLLAQHAGRLVGDVKRALEIRQHAADERDAADKRLEDHKRSCPVCREAIRQFCNPHKKP